MAKLRAYGQQEVLRVEREKLTPDGDLTIWARETRAVMHNGRVLRKHDVRFRPDAFTCEPRFHSYGWKLWGKVAAGKTPETFRTAHERAGWRVASA